MSIRRIIRVTPTTTTTTTFPTNLTPSTTTTTTTTTVPKKTHYPNGQIKNDGINLYNESGDLIGKFVKRKL